MKCGQERLRKGIYVCVRRQRQRARKSERERERERQRIIESMISVLARIVALYDSYRYCLLSCPVPTGLKVNLWDCKGNILTQKG